MKPTPKSVRDARRDECLKTRLQAFNVSHEGKYYTCYVMDGSKMPNGLEWAIMRFTPSKEELEAGASPEVEAFFIISGAVPEKFCRFVVLHEILEFLKIGLDVPGRCRKAAEAEVHYLMTDRSVSPAEKIEYLAMRAQFFKNLIEYCKDKPDAYTQADLDEFEASRVFFDMEHTMLNTDAA